MSDAAPSHPRAHLLPPSPIDEEHEVFEPRPLNGKERAAILPYRGKYLAEGDKAKRYQVIKEGVFVAMFNYWDLVGEGELARQQQKPRIKVCVRLSASYFMLTLLPEMIMGFIHNNWRRTPTIQFDGYGDVVVRKTSLIYEIHRARVDAQITLILGLTEPVTTTHPQYFSTLNVGISQLAKALTPEEDAVLRETQEDRRKIGNPPDIQKRYMLSQPNVS